jgi:hypothetical protein
MNTAMKGKLLWLAGAAFFILLLLVGFRIYGYFQLQKSTEVFVKEIGPLQSADYSPTPVVATENAGTLVQGGAYSMMMNSEERAFLRRLLQTPYQKWDSSSVNRARALIKRNEAAYQVLAQSVPLEKSSLNLKYGLGWNMPIPNLQSFLQAGFIVGTKARLQLIDNDLSGALATMMVQERMVAALLHERVMISYLIGEVGQKDYDALIQQFLSHADAQMLQSLEKQLQHIRSMKAPLQSVLAAEVVALYSAMRENYPEAESNGTFWANSPGSRWIYRINRRLFLSDLLESYTDLIKQSEHPAAGKTEEAIVSGLSPLQRVELAWLPSTILTVLGRVQATDSELILADLAVKLCLYKKQTGHYPADLTGLNPERSPYTGEPVHYKLQPDGSADLAFPQASHFWDKSKFDPARKPLLAWKLPDSENTK